jgi:DNA adenine methylase
MEEWRRQKNIYENPKAHSILELGFATFYLNRTNRSGIIKKGSVIGGLDQTGKWKIDARFNREELAERVQRVASYSDQIRLYNQDAVIFLAEISSKLPGKSFIYADPPYYEKGNRLYENFYVHEDHILVARILKKLRIPWIVSYDDVLEIREIYSAYRQFGYSLTYSASQYLRGSEVLIVSPQLTVFGADGGVEEVPAPCPRACRSAASGPKPRADL